MSEKKERDQFKRMQKNYELLKIEEMKDKDKQQQLAKMKEKEERYKRL